MLFQIEYESMQALSKFMWVKDLELIEKDTENDEISDWGIECKSDIFSRF